MQIKTSTIKDLLDLIGKLESSDNYNILYGGKNVPLTTMTLKMVLDFQSNLRQTGAKSTAIGRYQIIYPTLRDLQEKLRIPLESVFNEQFQDSMAIKLMTRRGLKNFLEESISIEEFMLNLSKEWASLPKDKEGRSYYAGDGLNKALISGERVLEVLESIKQNYKKDLKKKKSEEN